MCLGMFDVGGCGGLRGWRPGPVLPSFGVISSDSLLKLTSTNNIYLSL